MTAVVGPEKPTLLFPEEQLAAQAVGLLGISGTFLQSKIGDVQAQLDLCSDSRGISFNPFNITEQFLQIDVIHNTVRRAVAEYGFCFKIDKEAECELLTCGQEFSTSMQQQLLLDDNQPVFEVYEGFDSGRFDPVMRIEAEPDMITSLAQSALEAADDIGSLPSTTLNGEPYAAEDDYTFFPAQGEVVPILGRLSCAAASAILDATDGCVNATIAFDCGPGQIYQMTPLGFERPVNLVTIWSKDKCGTKRLFHFEAEPELGVKPRFAVARAYLETTFGPNDCRAHYVTRLCQRNGKLLSVTMREKEIVNTQAVDSWQDSIADMARQAVAATTGNV